MDSILTSIKKLLGIAEEYDHFDADIISHINSTFLTLAQLGVGPPEGFSIKDSSAIWHDFIPETASPMYEAVKSYIFLKVKLLFDVSSLTAANIEAHERQIHEFECRLNILAES